MSSSGWSSDTALVLTLLTWHRRHSGTNRSIQLDRELRRRTDPEHPRRAQCKTKACRGERCRSRREWIHKSTGHVAITHTNGRHRNTTDICRRRRCRCRCRLVADRYGERSRQGGHPARGQGDQRIHPPEEEVRPLLHQELPVHEAGWHN
jgi:hypothetical protein